MVRKISEVQKLIQQVELNEGIIVKARYIDNIEELRSILTNKKIKFQDGWEGIREHNHEVLAVGTTVPESVEVGSLDQYEQLDYGELIDAFKREIPASFDPNAHYVVLVKEEDTINYHDDFMHEKKFIVYYYNN